MLRLTPKSWFSWDFHVTDDGREVAFIDRDWFRERATLDVDGASYDVRRTSLLHGTFALEHDGRVVAEAKKTSAFRRAFELVTAEGERYELQAVSMFGRRFQLLRGGVTVGVVEPVSFLGRAATAKFPTTLSRPLQLFLVFLVLVLWKRATDAAASST